jgi:hypothetical protein
MSNLLAIALIVKTLIIELLLVTLFFQMQIRTLINHFRSGMTL